MLEFGDRILVFYKEDNQEFDTPIAEGVVISITGRGTPIGLFTDWSKLNNNISRILVIHPLDNLGNVVVDAKNSVEAYVKVLERRTITPDVRTIPDKMLEFICGARSATAAINKNIFSGLKPQGRKSLSQKSPISQSRKRKLRRIAISIMKKQMDQ